MSTRQPPASSPSPQPSRIPLPDGDDSAFYAALIHEYSEHEARVDGTVRLLAAKVDVAIDDVRTLSVAVGTQRKDGADMAVRVAAVGSSVAAIKLMLETLLDVPRLLRDHAKLLRDLQGAVQRLDDRLNRTEKRSESLSEIADQGLRTLVEDETTEVRARSLALQRRHRLLWGLVGVVLLVAGAAGERLASWILGG